MLPNFESQKSEADAQDAREKKLMEELRDVPNETFDKSFDALFSDTNEAAKLLTDLRRPAGDFTLMDGDVIDQIEKG